MNTNHTSVQELHCSYYCYYSNPGHLEASQRDGKRHIKRSVDNSSHRFDEGHEEKWEPDDTDQ